MVSSPAHPSAFAATALCCAWSLPTAGAAVAEQKQHYELPAGDAAATLKRFAESSGLHLVFMMDKVRGERTNAVRGEYAALDALRVMLTGTALFAVQDDSTGALVVSRKRPAPSQKEQGESERSRGPPSAQPTPPPATPKTAQPKHTESPPVKNRTLFAVLAGWLAAGSALDAQTTIASSSGARSAGADEVVQLSVFEVASTRDDSYGSTTSTSLTGTRKEMRRLPISAEIMNRALLDDLGALELREILQFAVGTGAQMGANSDQQSDVAGDRQGNSVGSLRGLNVWVSRDGLFSSQGSSIGSFDNFSKDRVEIIRGPQALLFGQAMSSGIILVSPKRASFARNSLRGTFRTDSEGSRRGEIEMNATTRVAGTAGQQVALLISSYRDHQKYWRVNNELESQGTFVAGAWRISPKLTLSANYERWNRHSTGDPTTIRLSAPANDPTFGSRNNQMLRLLLGQGRVSDIYSGGLSWANVDSFATDVQGDERISDVFSAKIDGKITPWLSVQVHGGVAKDSIARTNNGAANSLVPPGLSGNPTGEWALQLTPSIGRQTYDERALRAMVHVTLPKWRVLKSEITLGAERKTVAYRGGLGERWFEIDAQGEFIRSPANLNNGFSGRTVMPNIWWAPRTQGFDGPPTLRSLPANVLEFNGRRYRQDFVRNQFPQFVNSTNPLGFSNGSTGIQWRDQEMSAGFATLSTAWWDGRVDTIAGYRYTDGANNLLPRPFESQQYARGSHMLGINWHLSRSLTAYYAHSTTFLPSDGITIENKLNPMGSGVGDEVGLKFGFLNDAITGGLSAYSTTAASNNANLPSEFRAIANPSGLNGANGGGAYAFDRKSKGYEAFVTAQPMRGLRLQASFSHIKANEGADVFLPILYNDQFNVNAAGQVTLGNGTPLLVPVSPNTTGWNPASPTPGVPTQVLTLQILRNGDASGNYRASLDPTNGLITNRSALYLNTPTVGTGVTGLPVSQHQLGFMPAGGPTVLVRKGGDRSVGFPDNSFSLTANYTIQEGRLRRLAFGGNYRFELGKYVYYYTDLSTPGTSVRRPFKVPDQQYVTLFAKYDWRFKRGMTLSTQVNIANALNDVPLVTYPNVANGTLDNARLTNTPRVWTWTNTLRF